MIKFQNIPNPRELGGLEVAGGRKVREGRLFRTGYLTYATDEDLRTIAEEMGVKKVIDLRSEYEIGREPDREVSGAQYVHAEVMSLNGHLFKGMAKCFAEAASFEDGMATFVMGEAAKMICDGFYVSFVADPGSIDAYKLFMQEVLSCDGAPILWHCTQGKDRTGLGAAFILGALGATRETIIKDFDLSNDSYRNEMARIKALVRTRGGSTEDLDCVDTLVGVNVRLFNDALDYIDTHFGGMDAFIRNQLRMSEADIEKLRELYTV